MRSEARLHPLSILFSFIGHLRQLVLPGLLVLFGSRSSELQWELWGMLLIIPFAAASCVRYLTFSYRYDETALVIRSGLVFRKERHIPYDRIQNLGAVQKVLHRFFGVVEVRVETAGGQEPEATMRVLPLAALEEMRRRVFAGKAGAHGVDAAVDAATDAAALPPTAGGRQLLHLPPAELALAGLVHNRGLLVVAAGFGVFWESGVVDRILGSALGETSFGRGVVRDLVRSFVSDVAFPVAGIAQAALALAALLVLVRLFSVVWALVRLYDFRIVRHGEDLRTEYGLLTKVAATLPLHRVQTVHVIEGMVHRLLERVSVSVETAGGEMAEDGVSKQKDWLAPILRKTALPGLVAEVLPGTGLDEVRWQAMVPRAFRRIFRQWALVALVFVLPFTPFLGWWELPLVALALAFAHVAARGSFRGLGWALTDSAVFYRSGWLIRRTTIAPLDKIQVVALLESPFDRRRQMASLRVDTAGAADLSHHLEIPYLPKETATELANLLATRAAQAEFRW